MLYVAPVKALINDQVERLELFCNAGACVNPSSITISGNVVSLNFSTPLTVTGLDTVTVDYGAGSASAIASTTSSSTTTLSGAGVPYGVVSNTNFVTGTSGGILAAGVPVLYSNTGANTFTVATTLSGVTQSIASGSTVTQQFTDKAGNLAGTLSGQSATNLIPSVTSVTTSTATGSYKSGQVIPITVNFSRAVTVTGTPTLALNSSATVNYTSGSGTTALLFNYTVGASDAQATALDYSATSSLSAGTSIVDQVNTATNATRTLPVIGAAGSISNTKTIIIDTAVPTVSSSVLASVLPDGSVSNNGRPAAFLSGGTVFYRSHVPWPHLRQLPQTP